MEFTMKGNILFVGEASNLSRSQNLALYAQMQIGIAIVERLQFD